MNKNYKGTVTVRWSDKKTYHFSYTASKTKTRKEIYFGEFVGDAPDGLQCGVPYCVKMIHIMPSSTPQEREYFDLLDFHGEHLREILAMNPIAKQFSQEIIKKGTCSGSGEGWIVEPLYKSSRELFANCSNYPVSVRLDIILQYAKGCTELMKYKLGGIRILAHRDLKADNGMIDDRFGQIRVRLIDFASIRLDKENLVTREQIQTAENLDNTYDSGAMSSSNTTPEYLSAGFGEVGEKADVYALGMLLGSLFLLNEKGKYVNPSYQWVRENGWSEDNTSVDTAKLQAGFRRCSQKDNHWNSTWIEQDMRSKLRWENIPDKAIRDGLRKLFFNATRIQVKDRISLNQFIQELDHLINLDSKSVAKAPVSMYLVDLTDFSRYRDDYCRMASYVFNGEKQVYGASAQALLVAYRSALPSDKSTLDAVKILNGGNLVSNIADMASTLASCNARNGTGSNMLAQAVLNAFQVIRRLTRDSQSRHSFTGRIHLFMPHIPEFSRMLSINLPSGPIGLMDFCGLMNNVFEDTTIRINAYTDHAPDPFSEDGEWYTYYPLHGRGSADPERRTNEPPPVKPHREKTNTQNNRAKQRDYFLIDGDGEFHYL